MKRLSILQSIILIPIVVFTSFFATCDDEPSNPPPKPIDSTSHSFVFFTDTLGAVHSRVNDVFCLSETEAYAVGEFYVRDSTGKVVDSLTCNLAKWNGVKWTLERVNPIFRTSPSFWEPRSVFAFSTNDLWLDEVHWDGKKWKGVDLNGIAHGAARKIWGASSNEVYFVGDNGSIIFWNGLNFQEIGFTTTAANCDGWGWRDTVLVATSDYNQQSGYSGYITRIINKHYFDKQIEDAGRLFAVWGMKGIWYAGGCNGGLLYKKEASKWQAIHFPSSNCISHIRGTEWNNVFFATDGRALYHFNGSTIEMILPVDLEAALINGLSATGKLVFLADTKNASAIVYRGYQQAIK